MRLMMNIIGGIDMTDLDFFNELFNPEPNSWVSFGQNQNRPKLTNRKVLHLQ